LPEHCVALGTHTPVHAPLTQAELIHAVAALHAPFVWHVSTPLPLHVVWPWAHTPLQAPETHVWLVQAAAFSQLPVELQV
jgi:hypothetical protein